VAQIEERITNGGEEDKEMMPKLAELRSQIKVFEQTYEERLAAVQERNRQAMENLAKLQDRVQRRANAKELDAKAAEAAEIADLEAKAAERAKAKEEAAEETKEEPKEEEEPEPDWEEMMKVDAEQFKDIKFMPNAWSDIHPDQESQIFHNFSIPVEGVIPERADRRWLPEGETLPPPGPEEGFAKVDFAWADKAGASAALDEWVKTKKKNEMVRNFRASKESQARVVAWNKSKAEWRTAAKKATLTPVAKKPKPDEETKEDEEKPEAADEKKEEEPAEDVEMEEVDVWTTENIHDVKGKRLYKEFDEDDWILATFRLEMLNMLVSFKTDVTSKDADRVGIAKSLLNQYYKAYYSRDLAPRSVGQETVEGGDEPHGGSRGGACRGERGDEIGVGQRRHRRIPNCGAYEHRADWKYRRRDAVCRAR